MTNIIDRDLTYTVSGLIEYRAVTSHGGLVSGKIEGGGKSLLNAIAILTWTIQPNCPYYIRAKIDTVRFYRLELPENIKHFTITEVEEADYEMLGLREVTVGHLLKGHSFFTSEGDALEVLDHCGHLVVTKSLESDNYVVLDEHQRVYVGRDFLW